MKYDVEYSCGHSGEVELFGPGKERDRKLEWLATIPCPACKREQQTTDRAARSAQSATANAADGLPALEGSPKQIAWAETIRREALLYTRAIERINPDKLAAATDPETVAFGTEYAQAYDEALKRLRAQSSAKWWIENRSNAKYLVQDAILAVKGKYAALLTQQRPAKSASEGGEQN